MWKRRLARYIPGLSHAVRVIEEREDENRQVQGQKRMLESIIQKIVFEQDSLVSRSEEMEESGAGKLPFPPPELRFLVAGTADPSWFLRGGKLSVETLVELLDKQGKSLDQFQAVLDQGCGCGRVLRHLDTLPPGRLHGCDVNSLAIRWCQNNLLHATCDANGLEPPLPYPNRKFDLVYSWSIFTHFPEPLQSVWMQELRRVLVPGGYLVMSLHGDSYLPNLTELQRQQYAQGQLVVQSSDMPGSNVCAAFHPESYVRNVLARGFDVVDFIPQGAKGCPTQDVYLLRLNS